MKEHSLSSLLNRKPIKFLFDVFANESKEICLVGGSIRDTLIGKMTKDIDIAAKMLFDFPEMASKIITHRFPIDSAVEAFKIADDRKSGSIKVVLDINI